MEKEAQYVGRILTAAERLFRKRGFRAVSMDELASEIGISKKTIYKYFNSKSKLVEALVMEHIEVERQKIIKITEQPMDPVRMMVEIGQLVYAHYKEMSPDVILELKKYFFDIWEHVDKMQSEFMLQGITTNLKVGVEQGLYRQDVDPDFLANVYVESVISSCDNEEHKTGKELYYLMLLKYHMYGVMTEKGRKLFEKYKTHLGE